MNDLGIILDFSANLITNNSNKFPMQSIKELPTSDKEAIGFKNSLEKNQESKCTELANQRIVQILDAKYKKADLPEIVQNDCKNLNPEGQSQLLEVLLEFEDLFDGTLGDWKTEPVSFELKEGSKPYHGRAYPIPQNIMQL
jgi:hypothetical protein